MLEEEVDVVRGPGVFWVTLDVEVEVGVEFWWSDCIVFVVVWRGEEEM